MAILKCKMCGGELKILDGMTVAECEYCGSRQTVPTADNEKKMTLFARANRLRAANEFDKAAGVYESIVADFPEEAEAFPTCHRSSFDSIMDDSDFEQVMENADPVARRVYRDEAKAIEEIRRSIIEVSSKEEPYDIFICYKETDENGDRTIDSVIAQDVYDRLTERGYKVFFSRITLEDKLGQEYEPYIFAALNSAKVMLAIGTDYDYYNAVWVKNEWSRFLALIAKGEKKTLIPCYKDIDAYDIPREFKHLQAQDMGKVGAMQDLLRGIGKLFPKKEQKDVSFSQPIQSGGPNTDSLLERAFIFIADREWDKADEYCEKVLDIDPKCSQAYLGKLLTEFKVSDIDSLSTVIKPISDSSNFKRILRHADDGLKQKVLFANEAILKNIAEENDKRRKENIYQEALKDQKYGRYEDAINKFSSIIFYRDSRVQITICKQKIREYKQQENYYIAVKQLEYDAIAVLSQAKETFESMPDFKDSREMLKICNSKKRVEL